MKTLFFHFVYISIRYFTRYLCNKLKESGRIEVRGSWRRSPKNLFTAAGSKSAAFQLPRVESRIFERPRGGRAGLGRFDKTWIDAGTRHGLPRVTVNGISPLHGHAQPHTSSPSITISTLIPSRLVLSLGPQFPRPSSRHAAKKRNFVGGRGCRSAQLAIRWDNLTEHGEFRIVLNKDFAIENASRRMIHKDNLYLDVASWN